MRAVNLIPSDTRRGARSLTSLPQGPGYLILAALAVAVALVTITVLTNNTISSRRAKLSSLHTQLTAEQTLASRLASYQKFAQLAQARAQTVREIVATRFDWHSALSDLSKVVPSDTTLQSLSATVSPNASAGGSSSGSALRGAISAPAFDISGCTRTQDDVARLMSRLRTMDGVTRVTLQDSAKGTAGQAPASTGSATGGSSGNCASGPSFHLVVFFSPLATVAPAAPGAQTVSTAPSAGGTP